MRQTRIWKPVAGLVADAGRRRPWNAVGRNHVRRVRGNGPRRSRGWNHTARACPTVCRRQGRGGRRRGIFRPSAEPSPSDQQVQLGEPAARRDRRYSRRSIEASLRRLRLTRLDLFFLHSNVVPDAAYLAGWPDANSRMTPYAVFIDHVRPLFARLVEEGIIGAWGLTGIGHLDIILRLLHEAPAPAADNASPTCWIRRAV